MDGLVPQSRKVRGEIVREQDPKMEKALETLQQADGRAEGTGPGMGSKNHR